jgi:hypothetical protein
MTSGTNGPGSGTGTDSSGGVPLDLPTSPEALEAAIQARRAHLSSTLDELVERVRPANLARDAKDEAVTRARGAVTDEHGNLLVERVAAIAAAVAAVVVVLVVARRRSHR